MADSTIAASRKPSSYATGLAFGVLAGALVALLTVMLAGHVRSGPLAKLWSALTGRNTVIMSQGSVVERIQRLQRMETVVYNMDKIVSGERSNPFLPDFLTGDRMLMVVHGQVVAGVDFDQLRPADVQISGRALRVHLPNPRVLLTRLDNARTRVYSRSTGLLVPVDPNLETRVREEAEGELLEEATRGGILTAARQNARNTLTTILLGLGFEKVEVD
jgi:uncharacterized protein DUF4230